MKYIAKTLFALTMLLCQTVSAQVAQEENQLNRNEGAVDDQFEYIISKSYTYRGNGKVYKNVQYHWLTELKASVLDSLNVKDKKIAETKAVVENQTKEIEDLKNNLANTQSKLDNTNAEKDSMSLFGLQMSKGGYNVLMWSIIGGLLALTLLFLYRFNNSNSATKAARLKLDELESEFEEQ